MLKKILSASLFRINWQTLFLAFCLSTAASVNGAEVDSTASHAVQLPDTLDALNTIFNQRIAEGVDKANQHSGDIACNEEQLYVELRKAIFQSFTASWGLKGYSLDKQMRMHLAKYSYSLPLEHSIYRDLTYLEAFSLNLKELSDLVNIDEHKIGLDKIGHFFAEGWQYFELSRDANGDLVSAADWGQQQEQGKFGYWTTGVYSYADLTANFNGWRFWNKVRLDQRDPLKGLVGNLFNRPYVSCELQLWQSFKQRQRVHAWSFNQGFDFADYVDGAWDESNNCNRYKNAEVERKVRSRIKHAAPQRSCPQLSEACVEAKARYGEYAGYLLHPACLNAH